MSNLKGNDKVFETRSRLGRTHDAFETRSVSASNNDLQEAKDQFSMSAAETADVLSKENRKERIRTPRGKVTAPASTSFRKPVGVIKITRIIAVLVVLFAVLSSVLPKIMEEFRFDELLPNETYHYETTIGEGTYTIGTSLPEGTYTIRCISGEGNLISNALDAGGHVEPYFQTEAFLSDGNVILIEGTAVLQFICEDASDPQFAPAQSI